MTPRKTHCKNGHPLTESNIRRVQRGPYVVHRCKRCAALYAQARYHADPKRKHAALHYYYQLKSWAMLAQALDILHAEKN